MGNINISGLIVVIGTPGSGKTRVAKLIAESLGCRYLNVGELSLEKGYVLGRDEERGSYIIDEERVREELSRIEDTIVVETISPYAIPQDKVSLVIVVRCRPSILLERLREREYSKSKIRENLEYEAIDGPLFDAMQIADVDKIVEIDGCEGNDEEIYDALRGIKKGVGRFNWSQDFLSILEEI
jgi:adenylate kinase